jgi:hypothetical protein
MAAPKGNQYTRKWNIEELITQFEIGLEYAKTNKNCLCLADAIAQTNVPYSTYDYYAEKEEVLGFIKRDTMVEVTRRINKGALQGDYNPASSIWRMKQLGEKDQQYQDHTTQGDKITPPVINFTKSD